MGIKRDRRRDGREPDHRGRDLEAAVVFLFPDFVRYVFSAALQHGGRRHRGAVRWHAGAGRRGRRYGPLINLFVNLFVGLASGTTVVIAQAYGAHDAESVGGTVHTSVALALAAGLGLTAVGVAAAPWALSAMGTPADIMDFALTYLRVYMLGTIRPFV